jgi:demethylmenaquinone methyltransferase / 2-methoxy-6-polyprenyl-1,4-benzoquinol methylase
MEQPYRKEQPSSIRSLFSHIAPGYDRTNAVMTFGLYKRWNRHLIRLCEERLHGPLLDLCAGTGEIALGYLARCPGKRKATLLDFCPEMLEVARFKAQRWNLERHDISYVEADAQSLPLADESVSGVTMAYGIRNVHDPLECAAEVHRCLTPGGFWAILELTRPRLALLRWGHKIYTRTCLPLIGRLLTSNEEAYNYLSSSVQHFITPTDLSNSLTTKGFTLKETRPLFFGVATLIILEKS